MTDYCTRQWTIVKYPCGAGGKFLINSLFLFNQVAHWHGVQGQQEIVNYFRLTLLDNPEPSWLKRELNHQWNTTFFSRSQLRNNNLTCNEFNQLIDTHASEFFKQCWAQGLDIVDHWAKPQLPNFWQNANSINIIVDDWDLYKTIIMSKLFKVTDEKIISLLDCSTEVGTESDKLHISQFNNQYEFPKVDIDTFFEQTIKQKPWLDKWLIDRPTDGISILLSELIDYHKFSQKFELIEDLYNERIPRKYVKELHDIWTEANLRCIDQTILPK